jgi:hypothetical protein
MKYMARILPWLYLGAFCLSLLCGAFFLFMPEGLLLEIGSGIIMYVGTMFVETIIIMTVVFIIMRIYRSLFSDEGYLTFTLPVKNSTVINAKILTGAVWTFFTLIVAVIVIMIPSFAQSIRLVSSEYISPEIGYEYAEFGIGDLAETLIFLFLVFLDAVVLCFLIPSLYTFCAALVHKAKKARAFASIGMFVGISYAVFVILVAIFIIIGLITESYYLYDELYDGYTAMIGKYLTFTVPTVILAVTAPLTLVSWLVSRHIVDKKLNML